MNISPKMARKAQKALEEMIEEKRRDATRKLIAEGYSDEQIRRIIEIFEKV